MPSQVQVNAKQEDTFQELLCVCVRISGVVHE